MQSLSLSGKLRLVFVITAFGSFMHHLYQLEEGAAWIAATAFCMSPVVLVSHIIHPNKREYKESILSVDME